MLTTDRLSGMTPSTCGAKPTARPLNKRDYGAIPGRGGGWAAGMREGGSVAAGVSVSQAYQGRA